ncbi:hypothetical protein HUT19_41305 (plasmid) [Streptomyces sp. NA02950]|uniref:hypothetical protein n=1 Tax=Streptomyces sp. NA02950 TaxID=2742137 RepID=UPI00159083DE|nr:hypothetical protein [Streptomyces sp. NA02950]QKV98161.1 hypothetical protein HUT19_41305 [Streptomyces sp. NA02950]
MTADVYLVVRCDATIPDEEDPAAPDAQCDSEGHWPVWVANHTELRRLLRTEGGWHRPKPGRDICPDCWTAGRR